MAIIGFIAVFIVLATCSLGVLFLLCCGGEEFSPSRGRFRVILLVESLALAIVWYWWWQCAPFSLHWK